VPGYTSSRSAAVASERLTLFVPKSNYSTKDRGVLLDFLPRRGGIPVPATLYFFPGEKAARAFAAKQLPWLRRAGLAKHPERYVALRKNVVVVWPGGDYMRDRYRRIVYGCLSG
jgi:hypothetical protein